MAKLSRSAIAKKAWKTRRANARIAKNISSIKSQATALFNKTNDELIEINKKFMTADSIRSIADEMDEAIANLEARLSATTKRINSIMKV